MTITLTPHFYYKKNRLQQLRGFYYAAQIGSISKTAELMHLSQPAVTVQIQSLENDLNVKLFERKNKKLVLTPDGHTLYKMAAPHIQAIDGMYEKFRDLKKNKINIAANHISILYLLPDLIREFKERWPDTQIVIRNLDKERAYARLKADEIDMFFYPVINTPLEFTFMPLVEYDPILLVRKDHPLAKKEPLTLEDVADYDLIRIDPHLITLPLFEEVIEKYGLGSNISFEMADWEVLKQFVKARVGVAIVSNICLDREENVLMGRALPQYFTRMTYGILMKKGRHIPEPVQNFLSLIPELYPFGKQR